MNDYIRNLFSMDNWGKEMQFSPTAHAYMAKTGSQYTDQYANQFDFSNGANGAEKGGFGSLGTWGNIASGISDIAGAWLGYQNLQLNQEKFDASKDMWNANYAANRQTTNNRIVDQATSRLGATGGMAADSMSHVKSNKLISEVTV